MPPADRQSRYFRRRSLARILSSSDSVGAWKKRSASAPAAAESASAPGAVLGVMAPTVDTTPAKQPKT